VVVETAKGVERGARSGRRLGEHETQAIFAQETPSSLGTVQIRAQLNRFFGWRMSHVGQAIARVLRKGWPVGDEHRDDQAPLKESS